MLNCRLITDIDEISDHEDSWETLRGRCGGSIFTSYRLSKLWLEEFGEIASPRLLIVEENGDLAGIATLALLNRRMYGIPVRTISFIGDDRDQLGYFHYRVLAEPGRSDVLDAIATKLKKLDWSSLWLNYLEDVPSSRSLIDRISSTWNGSEFPPAPSMRGSLTDGDGRTGHFRRKQHRNIRVLERDHDVSFRSLARDDVDRAVNIYAGQHVRRWEKKGGSIFQDQKNSDLLRKVFDLALSRKKGFIGEMLVDDQVVAQTFFLIENGIAIAYRIGMGDLYPKHSPGLAVIALSMDHMEDMGIRLLDMGPGGPDDYKRSIGGLEMLSLGVSSNRGAIAILSRMQKHFPSATHE